MTVHDPLCDCCHLLRTGGAAALCWQCEDHRIEEPEATKCAVLWRWERLRDNAAREARP